MVEQETVKVLGRSAVHDTIDGFRRPLLSWWRVETRSCFAGFEVPIQMKISAEKIIFGVAGIHPQRREELIKVLGIDLSWRMHKVSDGQTRRVQLCMALLKPFKVLLLDEIMVDLDVLARSDLLRFLKKECVERSATIIYATHIFYGFVDWPSHIRTVESWLRKERDDEWQRRKERKAYDTPEYDKKSRRQSCSW